LQQTPLVLVCWTILPSADPPSRHGSPQRQREYHFLVLCDDFYGAENSDSSSKMDSSKPSFFCKF